jgi:hypothetical protein
MAAEEALPQPPPGGPAGELPPRKSKATAKAAWAMGFEEPRLSLNWAALSAYKILIPARDA